MLMVTNSIGSTSICSTYSVHGVATHCDDGHIYAAQERPQFVGYRSIYTELVGVHSLV